MYNNSFFKKILLVATVFVLYSCDKDYNEVGGDIIGGNNFDLASTTYSVLGYNLKTGPIQSNNLDVNPLGIYNNPVFGETTANFNTQLALSSFVTSIGARPYVESVVLTVPYYIDETKTKTNANGSHVYVLDSIYGPQMAKMKLSVYESGYSMVNPGPITGYQEQTFFTDQNDLFDTKKEPTVLNDSDDDSQNNEFFFDSSEDVVDVKDSLTGVKTTKYIAPAMNLNLNKAYFKTKILEAINSGKLASNEAFRNHFKGLYFKVEKSGSGSGNLAMLNFKAGKITITYNQDLASTTGGAPTREKKTIVLNMSGNTVSLLKNDYTVSGSAYNSLPSVGDNVAGDERLYLKGGQGSVSVLELFDKKDIKGYDSNGNLTSGPNGVPDELDDLRNPGKGKKVLVNEANLVFHIDASAMTGADEPQRVYLYDFKNNRPIIDYSDPTSNVSFPKKSKVVFGGLLKLDATTKRGSTYKIRITNQIRNLINNKDSTNVKLGLVVTENIANTVSSKLKTANTFISQAPKASVMNPLGTVLYSGKSTVPDEKRLKLEIYFTKPN